MNFLTAMRKFLLVFVFVFSAFPLLAQERHGPYKIHKFMDGDTFWVKMDAGISLNIQLYLLNSDDPIKIMHG